MNKKVMGIAFAGLVVIAITLFAMGVFTQKSTPFFGGMARTFEDHTVPAATLDMFKTVKGEEANRRVTAHSQDADKAIVDEKTFSARPVITLEGKNGDVNDPAVGHLAPNATAENDIAHPTFDATYDVNDIVGNLPSTTIKAPQEYTVEFTHEKTKKRPNLQSVLHAVLRNVKLTHNVNPKTTVLIYAAPEESTPTYIIQKFNSENND